MSNDILELGKKIVQDPEFKCPICGSPMYITDYGNHELTFHCSSAEARFWDFDRGTTAQLISKMHWDQSKKEVFPSMEDAMNFVLLRESIPTNQSRSENKKI